MACVATQEVHSTYQLFAILLHLDFRYENLAWKSAIRLANGQVYIQQTHLGKGKKMYYTIPVKRFERNDNIVIPERTFWSQGKVPSKVIHVYTDGSKIDGMVGSGVQKRNIYYRISVQFFRHIQLLAVQVSERL